VFFCELQLFGPRLGLAANTCIDSNTQLKERITTAKHNSIFIIFFIYYSIMGYMFRLLFESSSGPEDVDPDIQTFTAL